MEAATVAAGRGHEVVLCEKNAELGGQLYLASQPPFKTDIRPLIDYFVLLVSKVSITVKTQTRVTSECLKAHNFDTIVVATGAIPASPNFINHSEKEILSVEKVLLNQPPIGERVGVIGAGRVGCEVAEFLSGQGKKVILVEMLEEIAPDLHILGKERFIRAFQKLGVQILTGVKVSEIIPQGLMLKDRTSKSHLVEVDTVVFTGGYHRDAETLQRIEEIGPEVFAIGDCRKPQSILEAIAEGNSVGSVL